MFCEGSEKKRPKVVYKHSQFHRYLFYSNCKCGCVCPCVYICFDFLYVSHLAPKTTLNFTLETSIFQLLHSKAKSESKENRKNKQTN